MTILRYVQFAGNVVDSFVHVLLGLVQVLFDESRSDKFINVGFFFQKSQFVLDSFIFSQLAVQLLSVADNILVF